MSLIVLDYDLPILYKCANMYIFDKWTEPLRERTCTDCPCANFIGNGNICTHVGGNSADVQTLRMATAVACDLFFATGTSTPLLRSIRYVMRVLGLTSSKFGH